jgi:glyoxylase-like metal-dependent hydrolase (beta-lactamase superfamily II)
MKNSHQISPDLLFRQLFDYKTWTYTYLLADKVSGEGVLIDTVHEQYKRDFKLLKELGVKLKYTIDTHVHADHVTGAAKLRKTTGSRTVIGAGGQVECADVQIKDGETLKLGSFTIKAISTPGHTESCTSYHICNKIFTGDTLLIRGCGRTDFQQGSAKNLFKSIHEKLFILPDETIVYPAHDYEGMTSSTIGEEKSFNPRLTKSKSESDFINIMHNLKLANPIRIHEAVPLNLRCGDAELLVRQNLHLGH